MYRCIYKHAHNHAHTRALSHTSCKHANTVHTSTHTHTHKRTRALSLSLVLSLSLSRAHMHACHAAVQVSLPNYEHMVKSQQSTSRYTITVLARSLESRHFHLVAEVFSRESGRAELAQKNVEATRSMLLPQIHPPGCMYACMCAC